REGHPLAGRRSIAVSDLADADWVLPTRDSRLRRGVEALLRRHGVAAPQPVLNSNSLLLAQLTVAESDAVAVVAAPGAALFRAT
ncbi:hypothetical protein J8J27_32590, partial [Mycobacterium tuberculosis]|nr:hypothetical protein [Mycobacterium tuberculosis]